MRSLLLGTCCDCGTKCDSRAERCADCRWAHQRASQGPRRFWAKVDGDGECWLWTGCLMHKDYGQYRSPDGRTILAHRMAWILTYGEIPDELCVLHVCDEPRCVRPDHLWLGTKADNNRDMAAKGRHASRKGTAYLPRGDQHHSRRNPECVLRADRHPMARLNWDVVGEIRRAAAEGATGSEVARRFGISGPHARKIIRGDSWVA